MQDVKCEKRYSLLERGNRILRDEITPAGDELLQCYYRCLVEIDI